jgi:uncharacterized protein (TIGR03435 family)
MLSESLSSLAWLASRVLNKPVLDDSGIHGKFDIAIKWDPQDPNPFCPLFNSNSASNLFQRNARSIISSLIRPPNPKHGKSYPSLVLGKAPRRCCDIFN